MAASTKPPVIPPVCVPPKTVPERILQGWAVEAFRRAADKDRSLSEAELKVFLSDERDPFLINEGLIHSLFFSESDESLTHTVWHRFETTWTVTDAHFVIPNDEALSTGPEQTLAETYAFYVVNPRHFRELAAQDATLAQQLRFVEEEFFSGKVVAAPTFN